MWILNELFISGTPRNAPSWLLLHNTQYPQGELRNSLALCEFKILVCALFGDMILIRISCII